MALPGVPGRAWRFMEPRTPPAKLPLPGEP